jgi:oligopeptide transport system permease protein
MVRYILQRILAMILTLLIILTVAFMVVRLMPGSVFDLDPELSDTAIKAMNAKYHFDQPMIKQYGYFMADVLFHNDWGTSIAMRPNVAVWDILKDRIPVTLKLNLISLFAALLFGLFFGIVAAINKNTLVDHLVSLMVVLFISIPSFIYAAGLQYFVGYKWLPLIYDPAAHGWPQFRSMILPMLALSFDPIARVARYLRAELIENINSDYMLLAKAKGLTFRQSIMRHALRNSMVPMMNIIIPMFAEVLSGSLVIESIFAVAGMGGLMVDSINSSDHMLTVAILMFYSLISLITILIVDISYGIVDPRVRMGVKG